MTQNEQGPQRPPLEEPPPSPPEKQPPPSEQPPPTPSEEPPPPREEPPPAPPEEQPPIRDANVFPPPWSADELDESFAIKDASGQILAYVYFEPDPNNETRRSVMNRLTRLEAWRIAANIAKLPAFIEADRYRKAKGE